MNDSHESTVTWLWLAVIVGLLLLRGGEVLTPAGPRQVLIVHESAEQTPAFAEMVRDLRTGAHAEYLNAKQHSLLILDDETPGPDGSLASVLVKWGPFQIPEQDQPQLLIVNPPDKLLSRSPLPATATEVMAAIKAQGG